MQQSRYETCLQQDVPAVETNGPQCWLVLLQCRCTIIGNIQCSCIAEFERMTLQLLLQARYSMPLLPARPSQPSQAPERAFLLLGCLLWCWLGRRQVPEVADLRRKDDDAVDRDAICMVEATCSRPVTSHCCSLMLLTKLSQRNLGTTQIRHNTHKTTSANLRSAEAASGTPADSVT